MKVSYYPGCSLEGTAGSYDASVRHVCRTLGVDLHETPEWACCGSSPALKMNRLLSASLAAQNLRMVEQQGRSDVVAPCPFCFRRLKSAQDEMKNDPVFKAKVEEVIEAPVRGDVNVHNLLGFIHGEVGIGAVAERVKKPLSGLRLIPYYGCYVVKPANVTRFDDPENPTSLDDLLRGVGAEVLDWDLKTECCGAGLSLSKTDMVSDLCGRITREAEYQQADAIVVVCQLCQANLDMRQGGIQRLDKRTTQIPIVYFTQVLGLAFGISPKELGLDRHIVAPLRVLKQKGFA